MITKAKIRKKRKVVLAPLRNRTWENWKGAYNIFNYKVTAIIPHLDTPRELKYCIELLKLQTVSPYIIIIDTGSTKANLKKLDRLRSEQVEIHELKFNGVTHPSEFVTAALDLGFSVCRTEHVYLTHTDVFVKRIDFLEDLLRNCSEKCPAIGYEITQRKSLPPFNCIWKGMLGHTACMYYMPIMDKIGAGWSLRRLSNYYKYKLSINKPCNHPIAGHIGWPDTETLLGELFRDNNIRPLIIGKEENYKRTLDKNIDHCRSLTGVKLYDYSQTKINEVQSWIGDAIEQAKKRIAQWKNIRKRRFFDENNNLIAEEIRRSPLGIY